MPISTAAHAATADATAAAIMVAQATNEVGGGGILQSYVGEGNKTSYAEVARTGIAAADAPAGGDLTTTGFAGTAGANLGDCGNALTLSVRATCSTAAATLTGRVVLYDASNNPISVTESSLSFKADATLRLGNGSGDFIAPRALVDAGQARKFRFLVDSVSAGTWSVMIRPI